MSATLGKQIWVNWIDQELFLRRQHIEPGIKPVSMKNKKYNVDENSTGTIQNMPHIYFIISFSVYVAKIRVICIPSLYFLFYVLCISFCGQCRC